MNIDQTKQEETIDVKALLIKYTNYWYYFLISLVFCGFIAFLSNRYTTPVYSVSTTLLIRDDNNTQLGAENLLEGLELFSGKKNLTNEIIILNSYKITEQVIKELSLGLSYFQHGLFQTNEMFENAPFIVNIDSTHNQLTATEFGINIIDENSFELTAIANDQFPYNLKTEKFNKTLLANININEVYQFDQQITSEYYSFTISKSLFFKADEIEENNKTYSFKLQETDKLAHNLITNIIINPINKETSILKLNIKAKNPKKNINILNKLCEIYIESGLDNKKGMAVQTIKFIDKQLNVIQDSLSLIENQLQTFKLENPNLEIVDMEYGTYFQKQKLDNTLSEQSVHIKYYQSLLSYIENEKNTNSIVSPTSMGISNPELNSLINQLLQLYAKKGELQLTTTERNPAYKAIISQIDHTRNTIIENVKNLISSSTIYKDELIKRINLFNNNINDLPEAEKEYLILKRKYEYNEKTAIYLQQKKYEASLAKAGTEPDHAVIDKARLDSDIPVKPRKSLAYFIAIIIGLFLPIAFISLRDFLSDTINSKSDLKKATRIPVLGVVGHSEQVNSMVVANATKSIISESFRALRTNIQYLAANKKKKIITITSSIGGEGKTFTAMNLAAIFAIAGNKTILIGADLRKPKLHEDFNLDEKNGLSSYLIEKSTLKEVIEKTELNHLDVIGSGPTPPNPAELLDSIKMQELIKDLNKKYDYVIIDTPPIGLVTDGVLLMQHADINLYVVRHGYSKTTALSVINNLYEKEHVQNAQIIINDFKYNSTGYGYGYGYGTSGYGYYEDVD